MNSLIQANFFRKHRSICLILQIRFLFVTQPNKTTTWQNEVFMNLQKQLENYHAFDEQVIEAVVRSAYDQDHERISFGALAARYGIANEPDIIPGTDEHNAFQVLRIIPNRNTFSENEARVYWPGMATPIDPNLIVRGLRLAAADPTKQLILTGNPSSLSSPYNKLGATARREVARGNLSPAVEPVLRYLGKLGITDVEHIGYSLGADKAAVASACSGAFDMCVRNGVFIESITTERRSLLSLATRFAKTTSTLEANVKASNSDVLLEARQLSNQGFIRYTLGYFDPTNVAIVRCLTGQGFVHRMLDALRLQTELRAVIACGTASELTPYAVMQRIADELKHSEFGQRVSTLLIEGMNHNSCENINLHAAIVLQGIRQAEQSRNKIS